MKFPPLRLWVLALIFLGASIVLLNTNRRNIRGYLFNKSIEAAFRNSQSDKDDVKVVLLCSSQGKESLSNPDILSRLGSQNEDSIQYSFIKITRNMASLEDYAESDLLLEKIRSYNPTYIIIQESVSFFKLNKTLYSRGLQNDIKLGMHIKALYDPDTYLRKMSNYINYNVIDSMQDGEEVWIPDRQVRPNHQILSNFIKRINCKVVILHVPYPSAIESRIDSIRSTADYTSLFQLEQAEGNFSAFWFLQPMPYKYYYDRAHMNNHGEEIYTQWFIDKLHQFHLSQIQD